MDSWHGHCYFRNGKLHGHTYRGSDITKNIRIAPLVKQELENFAQAARDPSCLDRPLVILDKLPDAADPTHDLSGGTVFDLEWNRDTREIGLLSAAYEPAIAYSVHWDVRSCHWLKNRSLLGPLIGHNIINADCEVMGWAPPRTVDTMVLAHLVNPHFAGGFLGLGDLVRYYFPTTDWKNVIVDAREYSGLDSAYTAKLYLKLKQEAEELGCLKLYPEQDALARMAQEMHREGIGVDEQAVAEFYASYEERQARLAAQLPFNWRSPKQVLAWAQERGVFFLEDTTAESIQKAAVSMPEIPELPILAELKDAGKSLKAWFPKDADRIFPEFKVTGTDVDRFSSKGPNVQNLPPDYRRFIRARPGYKLYAWDASQIENRMVALVAGCTSMIEDFKSGADFHQRNTDRISALLGRPITRNQGKTVTHATNYIETPWNLARRMLGGVHRERVAQADRIQRAYFAAYPEIYAWHQQLRSQISRGDSLFTNLWGRPGFIYAMDEHGGAKRAAHFLGCSPSARLVNRMALRVQSELGLRPFNIVHDELAYELPEGCSEVRKIDAILADTYGWSELQGVPFPFKMKEGYTYDFPK